MSFNLEIKSELVRHKTSNPCCALAELSALCLLDGKFSKTNDSFIISFFNPSIAKRALNLFDLNFKMRPSVKITTDKTLGRNHKYQLELNSSIWQQLHELGIIDESLNPILEVPARIIKRRCCKNSYIRGAFLARGYVTNPIKSNHLELILPSQKVAFFIKNLLANMEIEMKIDVHNNKWRLYIKSADETAKFMAATGCHSALLRLEDLRIVKEIKSLANRLANCDSANVQKIVSASLEQIKDIKTIDETIGMNKLPPALSAVCRARLENPDIGIEELGQKMEPPLSKSAVYHRLRRIAKLAKQALN